MQSLKAEVSRSALVPGHPRRELWTVPAWLVRHELGPGDSANAIAVRSSAATLRILVFHPPRDSPMKTVNRFFNALVPVVNASAPLRQANWA